MSGREVIEAARRAPLLEVAAALGHRIGRRRDIYVCPACGREKRNASTPSEKRGAIGVRTDLLGGRCFPCGQGFDSIDFAAFSLHQRKLADLDDDRRREVLAWLAGFLGLDFDPAAAEIAARAARARAQAPKIEAPRPLALPDRQQLAVVWSTCRSVLEDDQVSAYLESRRIDACAVAELDLARALPRGAELPAWGTFGGRPWSATGHRLLVPLCDARGVRRSLLARRVVDADSPKSVSPKDHTRSGLLMADSAARDLLARAAWPSWWPVRHRARLWVCEGEIDFLLAASLVSDAAELPPATVGIYSGSWTPEMAARIPRGTEVVIATDPDAAGDKYAADIMATLHRTVGISRWRAA